MNTGPALDALAGAVLGGEPVDWATASQHGTAADQATVAELRVLAAIVQLHRKAPDTEWSDVVRGAPEPLGTWGPLELVEKIGEGADGEVFRARDPQLDRDVALKLLRQGADIEVQGTAVVEEGRLLARVRHPNVLAVHGAAAHDGRVGVWAEYVQGRTLEELLGDQGPFGAREAAGVGVDLCRALAAVHRAGLLHRDIKARNVMREAGGRLVLMDFGLGQVATADQGTAATSGGTPIYMAPELFRQQAATVESDLYGAGVVLWHLLTASYPVTGTNLAELRDAHAGGKRARLRDQRPDLPSAFIAVVERACDPDPARRYSSAGELEAALDDALRQNPETASEASARASAGRQAGTGAWWTKPALRWSGAAMLTLVLAGAALAMTWPRWWPDRPALSFKARDWVLVARFENRTGESVLDDTLEFALKDDLANSKYLVVASPKRIADALALMRQEPTAVLEAGLARQVCLRDGGIRALITGRVDKLANAYSVSVQVVEPGDGRTVATITEGAETQAELLPAVRRVAGRLRRVLGEPGDASPSDAPQLARVTTPSLEAAQLYTRAIQAQTGGDWAASVELLAAAIAEDPNFASAEVWLAWALSNLGRQAEAAAHFKRAVELTSGVSERERLFILGSYHMEVSRDYEKAIANYEALIGLHPDDFWALNHLTLLYGRTFRPIARRFHAALRMTEIRPNAYLPYVLAVYSGLIAGAERPIIGRLADKALSLVPSDPELDPWPLDTAMLRTLPAFELWLDGDGRGAGAALDGFRSHLPAAGKARRAMVHHLADQYLALGRTAEAEQLYGSQGVLEPSDEWSLAQDLATVALARGDRASFRRMVRLMYDKMGGGLAGDRADADRVWFLERAGTGPEAARFAAQAEAAGAPYADLATAEAALRQGARALARLRKGLEEMYPMFGKVGGVWWRGHESLADAQAASGDLAGAVRDLETALSFQRAATSAQGSLGFWVLRLRMKLADLYRRVGRTADAEAIERSLLELLEQADADFEIAARLRARLAR